MCTNVYKFYILYKSSKSPLNEYVLYDINAEVPPKTQNGIQNNIN